MVSVFPTSMKGEKWNRSQPVISETTTFVMWHINLIQNHLIKFSSTTCLWRVLSSLKHKKFLFHNENMDTLMSLYGGLVDLKRWFHICVLRNRTKQSILIFWTTEVWVWVTSIALWYNESKPVFFYDYAITSKYLFTHCVIKVLPKT